MADVDDHGPAGREPLAGQLEELLRRQVERDVGLAVGVDDDHVVVAVGPAQPGAGVVGVGVQVRAVEVEVARADLGQLAVDLDAVDAASGK